MKKNTKIFISVLLALTLLAGGTLAVLYFGFDINPFTRSGWKTRDGNTYYRNDEGEPLLDWQEIEGRWYYFDPAQEGAMVTGWMPVENGLVYLGDDGARASGWLRLEEGTYYLNPSDGLRFSGWLEDGGERYFFNDAGRMATGWVEYQGLRYYLDESGAAYTGWLEDQGQRYLLDGFGAAITGWIETPEGRCYLDDVTGAVSTGWTDTPDGRFYLDELGHPISGWTDTPEGRCFLDENGQAATGFVDDGGKRYYLDENGLMTLGWLELEGDRYYFREDGTMAIGEVEIDGNSRFFASTGKYVVLVNRWNPLPDDYEVELVNYGGNQVSAECYDQLVAMIKQIQPLGYYNVTNGYRSEATQQAIWDRRYNNFRASGYSHEEAMEEVGKSVAVPGTSEHHLGLSVDIDGVPAVHGWLAEHSWEYGFIVRYPDGKSDITGILYEPWHFRYVGVELAKELYDLGLCLEEYMDMLTAQNTQ